MAYTENTLVQQTTANYLEQQLGWQSVLAWEKKGVRNLYIWGVGASCFLHNIPMWDGPYPEAVS